MSVRRYSLAQLLACLAAAEAQWARASWDEAGMWKNSIHRLRDRISQETSLQSLKVQSC